MVHLCFTYIEYNSALDLSVPGLLSSTVYVCTSYIIFRLDNNSMLLLPCLVIYYNVFVSLYFWCPCMTINNVSVHYNGGLLPDIILLTQCYYHNRGTRLDTRKRFCVCSP